MVSRKLIDSLAKAIPKNIPPFWHTDEIENKDKNVYMCSCLHYYQSKELDKIAKREYKKYRRLNKE
jgi:hypothetical protein